MSGPSRFTAASGLAASLAVAALLVAACSPTRAYEAALVLADVAAGPADSRLKRTTPPPRRRPVAYTVDGRQRHGDLYVPGTTPGAADAPAPAGMVLVPGAARRGKDDPRLVAFAKTLARARFTVLVPDIASLRALRVSATDARDVADAVLHLAGRTAPAGGAEGHRSVGIVAFSYAAGPAIVAALDAEAGARVRFVVAVGGYHDMTDVVTFFTTGYYRGDAKGPWRHRTPNAYGKWVFVKSNVHRIVDAGDRAALTEMADRKMADLKAGIADLVDGLGPEGRSVHALLENRDPDGVPALIAALPEGMRADMAALDLSDRDLGRLGPRLYLIHGRDDPIIPFTQSRALAAAAGEATALYVVDSLAHVDLGPTGAADTVLLWRATYRLLKERDDMAARGGV